MTNDSKPDLDAMIYALPCGFCGMPSGKRCIAPRTGRLYPYPHAARYHAATDAGIVAQFERELKAWQEVEQGR